MNESAKRAVQHAARLAGSLGVLGLLERLGRGRPGDVAALMYHRVAPLEESPQLYPGLVSATPDEFEQQMLALRERHAVISVDQLLAALAHREPLPERAVMLTFDDGYRDFADHAWPVLRGLGLPAVLFVPSGFAERGSGGFWWDRLHAVVMAADPPCLLLARAGLSAPAGLPALDVYRRLRDHAIRLPHVEARALVDTLCAEVGVADPGSSVLGWDELRRLAREGLTVAGHTRSHPLLDRVPPEEMRTQIAGGLADLQRELGPSPAVFAYPGGACPDEAVKILAELGIAVAFTTEVGVANLCVDAPLLLPRIPVSRGITRPLLRVQLLPQFARISQAWRQRRAEAA